MSIGTTQAESDAMPRNGSARKSGKTAGHNGGGEAKGEEAKPKTIANNAHIIFRIRVS